MGYFYDENLKAISTFWAGIKYSEIVQLLRKLPKYFIKSSITAALLAKIG
jgi:hypothetical protein